MPAELAELPPGFPEGFGQDSTEREAGLLLACLQGITPRSVRALAWREGTATACLRAIAAGGAGSDNDRAYLAATRVEDVRDDLRTTGARFAVPGDDDYWPAFTRLADPPVGVFLRGAPLGLQEHRVAIVGARHPSATGREVASTLGRHLAMAGVGVVSGGALGIDAAAHRGALDGAGRTVAVLGSGIDRLQPRSNAGLFRDLLVGAGTIVSEYPPGVPPDPWRFPARNRLIAALSRGVVVVEGRAKSGTRITAEHAVDLGLDVFAVPGAVTSPLSATPHALLRDGAIVIRDARDLLEDLGFDPSAMPRVVPVGLPEDERRVLDALVASMLPETVARAVGMSTAATVAVLVRLELRGIVRTSAGRYQRTLQAVHENDGSGDRTASAS